MANKAKIAHGSRKGVEAAIASGTIDTFDILFLNGEGETPAIGWVDKDKNPIIPNDVLENQVSELESEIAKKVNVDALDNYLTKKYEISHKPEGTLVNYRDKEIRVMCPVDTKWTKQNVGSTGNANMHYMGFKAYAPDGAVSFKEDDKAIIEDQTMYYFENNDFAGIDENGRKYSIIWLALASYDETSDTWSYFGAKSTTEKYIGWYYSVEWYDIDGVLIESDCIRINLSNENCHASIEPFYMSNIIKTVNAYTDEQIEAKVSEMSGFEIVEF